MRLTPLEDRLVIKKDEAPPTSSGGIILPDNATKEAPNQGAVLAVGPGKVDDHGKLHPIGVEVGQTILFAKYTGTEIKLEGVMYLILAKRDVLAILEPS